MGGSRLKLLLDTHAWVWSLGESERLSPRARSAIGDPANQLHLSPLSVWEAILLMERGRLEVDTEPLRWVRLALARTPATMVTLTHEIAIASHDLPGYSNRDPVDRFLAATCGVLDMVLVTADRSLRRYRPLHTVW